MARKNILTSGSPRLAEAPAASVSEAPAAAPPSPAPQKSLNPNVRRFRATFEDLQKRSIRDIDTAQIRGSRQRDRFDIESDLDDLEESIRQSGQQIPVLLRQVADVQETIYEPVYGRRRIAACMRIGVPVKAIVAELSDEEAILAQGLENTARLDTSFIERAVFVASLLDSGYSGVLIEKALGINQSLVSRMNRLVRDIPENLIRAIGPAHGVGRRPWEELREIVIADDAPPLNELMEAAAQDIPSADRIKAVLVQGMRRRDAPEQHRHERDIVPGLLQSRRTRKGATLHIAGEEWESFADHLEGILPEIHAEWRRQQGDDA